MAINTPTPAAAAQRASTLSSAALSCRLCGGQSLATVVDLGLSPLANHLVANLHAPETLYPLHVRVCHDCFLVQLPNVVSAATLFDRNYPYFSSFSSSWLHHAEAYVEAMVQRYQLGPHSKVVELASNDGYLLQYFAKHQVPVLGIEPAANVARAAEAKGIPTRVCFFGTAVGQQLAEEGVRPQLMIANNVLAHVPDVNDFVGGIAACLHHQGTLTVEFPHWCSLVANHQFDTIYHEHYSYFSLTTACTLFKRHGLQVVDVERLPTHGGSLRLHVQHLAAGNPVSAAVTQLLAEEAQLGITDLATYQQFGQQVAHTKRAVWQFLLDWHAQGNTLAGYGAPAKCATLLNYCGVGADWIPYTVDKNPAKQQHFLPGVRIPVTHLDTLVTTPPDGVVIFPWNLTAEIMAELRTVLPATTRYITWVPQPTLQV